MRIIIIGGSVSGVAAAIEARKQLPDAEISLLEKGTAVGVLPNHLFWLLAKDDSCQRAYLATDKELASNYGINVYFHTTVVSLHKSHLVTRDEQVWPFDRAIIATGSGQFSNLITAHEVIESDMKQQVNQASLIQKIDQADSIAIIGAGLLGMTFASALAHTDKHVLVFERANLPLIRYFNHELVHTIMANASSAIDFHIGEAVDDVTAQASGQLVVTEKNSYPVDLTLLAVNTRPSTQELTESLQKNADGTIWVDDYLQTSQQHVFAIGDAIQVTFKLTGESVYLSSIANALRTARIVSHNLKQLTQKDPGTVRPYSCVLFERWYGTVGLTLQEAMFYPQQLASYKLSLAEEEHVTLICDTNQIVVGGQLEANHLPIEHWHHLIQMVQKGYSLDQCIVKENYTNKLSDQDLAELEVGLDAIG